jgi:hypothetical protein
MMHRFFVSLINIFQVLFPVNFFSFSISPLFYSRLPSYAGYHVFLLGDPFLFQCKIIKRNGRKQLQKESLNVYSASKIKSDKVIGDSEETVW